VKALQRARSTIMLEVCARVQLILEVAWLTGSCLCEAVACKVDAYPGPFVHV